jgi:putative addiction module component (TIGR02574 family)
MVRASDLTDLPVNEKLQLITELWDQIASRRDTPVLPDWVRDESNRRFEAMDRDPGACLTAEQMWQQVDETR